MQGPSSGSTTAGPPCLTSLPSPLPPNDGARRRTARATTTAGLPQAVSLRGKRETNRGLGRSPNECGQRRRLTQNRPEKFHLNSLLRQDEQLPCIGLGIEPAFLDQPAGGDLTVT